jgi:hypothetical protein
MVKSKWNNLNIPKKIKAVYEWNAHYALTVHEGRTTNKGTVIPARPWTTVVSQEFDFKNQYIYNFNQTKNFKSSFIKVAEGFGGAMQESITSPIWQYPRITVRQNGSVVSSPRDIYDLGNLYESYSMEVQQ